MSEFVNTNFNVSISQLLRLLIFLVVYVTRNNKLVFKK